jgi:AraC-like DNA-binding protein
MPVDLQNWAIGPFKEWPMIMNKIQAPTIDSYCGARSRLLEMSGGRCQFGMEDGAHLRTFRACEVRFARFSMKFMSWEGEGSYETMAWRTLDHHLAVYVPLCGQFQARVEGDWETISCGSSLVVIGAGLIRKRWTNSVSMLNIMIDRDALDQSIARLSHSREGSIALPQMANISFQKSHALAKCIEMALIDLISDEGVFREPHIGAELERLILQLIAHALSGETRQANRSPRIVPAYMRRAERYIRQSFSEPISTMRIAQAAGVSTRTVQYAFRKYRGASPLEFLRDIRLSFARGELARGVRKPIRTVALLSGYKSSSRFAKEYRAAFGETPTQTLRRNA